MIVCLTIPYFVAETERRHNPMVSDRPFVLVDSTRKQPRVAALSRQAAAADIHTGMALRHSILFAPELDVFPLHQLRYRQTLDSLIEELGIFTDVIELIYRGWGEGDKKVPLSPQSAALPINPAVLFLDVGKLTPRSLFSFSQQIQRTIEAQRLASQVGIASNRFTAWAAAISSTDGRVGFVTKGEEAWSLYCHPISLLPLDEKYRNRLWWLGIRTLGDFTKLPWPAIGVHFGKQGQMAYKLAQGIDPTPVRKRVKGHELSLSMSFDGGVAERETLHTALNNLLGQLVACLEASGETARLLRLSLGLDNRGVAEFETRLRRRSSTFVQLMNELQLALDRVQLNSAITEVTLTLGDIVPVAPKQLEIFPDLRLTESGQVVLDDLMARFGHCFYYASIINAKALLPENQSAFAEVDMP